jgi:3-keto-disaccharide hydrolase
MRTPAAALILVVVLAAASLNGQLASLQPVDLFNRQNLEGWINVNTAENTWKMRDGVLICSGHPIGVLRSARQYENFVLHIEWMHMEAGGNSGVFVWSDAEPDPRTRLPNGVEVQMLELEWPNLHKINGVTPPLAYVHGELFGVPE